jgi:hypothetical protein
MKIDRPITKLLDEGRAWCQKAEAYTAEGLPCYGHDPRAVTWCITGALLKVFPGLKDRVAASMKLLIAISYTRHEIEHIEEWNDAKDRTWAEIESVLKEARL